MIKKSEVGKKPVAPATPPVKKAEPVAAKAAKVEKSPKKVEAEVQETATPSKVSRKELSSIVRQKVMAASAAISPKVAEMVVIAIEETIIESLMEGRQVALLGFGTFIAVAKAETIRTNPQKPDEKLTIPAHIVPRFKPSKQFKVALNQQAEDVGDEDDQEEDE